MLHAPRSLIFSSCSHEVCCSLVSRDRRRRRCSQYRPYLCSTSLFGSECTCEPIRRHIRRLSSRCDTNLIFIHFGRHEPYRNPTRSAFGNTARYYSDSHNILASIVSNAPSQPTHALQSTFTVSRLLIIAPQFIVECNTARVHSHRCYRRTPSPKW
jgi:hypothetical protein